MAESKMPARIWATCNGMSTRLPDGHRQFIGGWSEDKDRPRAERFIRADLVEPLVEALRCLPVEWLKSGVAADSRSDGLRIEMRIVGTTYEAEITVGDLRSARAALQALEAAQ